MTTNKMPLTRRSEPTDEETQQVLRWAGGIDRSRRRSFACKKGGIN
jgi:hypothetical protein